MIKKIVDESELKKIFLLEEKIFKTSAYSWKTLKEMLEKHEYIIYASYREEQVLAYCILHDAIDVMEIMKIATSEEERQNGFGKKLLLKIISEWEKNILLEVRESNITAQNFYCNSNFQIIGKRKNYYSDNGEAAILMMYETNN